MGPALGGVIRVVVSRMLGGVMENLTDVERAILKANEHLALASQHVFNSMTLNREEKLEAYRLITEARKVISKTTFTCLKG